MKTFYLITTLLLALALSGGVYAYTYITATTTIGITEPTGDVATSEPAPSQPDWNSVLPGPTGAKILRPNADGDLTQFEQLVGAPTHWEAVDEEVADDYDSYVSSYTKGSTDIFGLTPSGLAPDTPIKSVTIYERARQQALKNNSWQITIKSGTTSAYSPTFDESKNWVDRSYQWTTDPDTGAAWTVAAIDTLQAGAYVVTGVCVTQVYVEVSYGGAFYGDVPTGDLFVITPHPEYSGDLVVAVYLLNAGVLSLAYDHLNMELTLQGADENPQLLTLHNGVATFNLQDCAGGTYTLSVTGGSYYLISANPPESSITPEFYSEVTQR